MPRKHVAVAVEHVERAIFFVRNARVILDSDLAAMYGVTTKRLNEQVLRNQRRFPNDFTFVLTTKEFADLRSQFATSNVGRGGRRYRPRVFTEHGALMAANVLNSQRAIDISVHVVRAFIRLRELAVTHKELAERLAELERRVGSHDEAIRALFEAIRQLMAPPPVHKPGRIGFQTPEGTQSGGARVRPMERYER